MTPLTILLVEDNMDHAELIKRSFAEQKISNKIYHVTDGEAALNYLFRRDEYADPDTSPRPRMILLDLRLPKVPGLEVLKELKESKELQRIPVVILTTSEGEEDYSKACAYHANSYLVKPLDFVKFTKMLSDLGGYWLDWNIVPFHSGPGKPSHTNN